MTCIVFDIIYVYIVHMWWIATFCYKKSQYIHTYTSLVSNWNVCVTLADYSVLLLLLPVYIYIYILDLYMQFHGII